MAEIGGEIGAVVPALNGFGATAKKGGFRDDKPVGADVAKELSIFADLDRLGGGEIALDLAANDDLGGLDFRFDDGFRPDVEGALGDDLTLKGAVEFKRAVEGEGAFDFHLIRDQSGAACGPEVSRTLLGNLGIVKGGFHGFGFTAVGTTEHIYMITRKKEK